ncbi:MAG: hypothetical protein K2X66_05200 [Cyanobacteria bacterium]|nr:hypothetical protein [Cyanobacteriota bacterium]
MPLTHPMTISDPVSPSQEEIEEALDILFPNSRPIPENRPTTPLLGKNSLMTIHPAFQKVTWPSNSETNSFKTHSFGNMPPMGRAALSSECVYSTNP